jgi:hypothetical protein
MMAKLKEVLTVAIFGMIGAAAIGFSGATAWAIEKADQLRSVGAEESVTNEEQTNPFVMNYTNIFYGPSVQSPSSYQPQSDGTPDTTRPIFMKNFLSAAYNLSDPVAITATAYWWYRPVLGQQLSMQDPFARISHASIINTSWGLNLYSDLRVHAGVTPDSRAANMLTGFQNFSYLTYQPGNGRLIMALRASARYNVYGSGGYGTDEEYYLAPELNYRVHSKLALTMLYEMGSSHQHGDAPGYITNDGTDLEPGVEWDPTPDIVVNPYLTLLTGGSIGWASTSVGMFFTVSFL